MKYLFTILATIVTILFVVSFFYFKEEYVFGGYFWIVFVAVWGIGYFLSSVALLEFNGKEVPIGKKHREKILWINIYVLTMFALLSLLYYAGYSNALIPAIFLFLTTIMAVVTIFFIMLLFFSFVIVEEDGLIVSSFLRPKRITIKYQDIRRIQFGYLMNTVKLYTSTEFVMMDLAFRNMDAILNLIAKNTTPEVHHELFESINRYYSMFGLERNLKHLDYFKENVQG